MTTFCCARCGAEVTAAVREVPLPPDEEARAPHEMADGEECPPRMAPGTYAIDPDPAGPPLVPATDKDGYALFVEGGPRNSVLLSPGDVRGLRRVTVRGRLNGCCGLDGGDGPNLACARCGSEIATESSDCWTFQQVRLSPDAVEPTPGTAAAGER